MSHSGGISSKLVFLSDLPHLKDRDKVRFLGCVDQYDIKTDELLLQHQYPHRGPKITASVNISLVRETLKSAVLQSGAWVNVVGYVQNGTSFAQTSYANVTVPVQAIMLLDTVALNLAEYEKAVQARKDAGTTG
ncbi:hypothetical protein BLS_007537 [Venturia inaequalis]|uniref:Uncharacterized protein n=1 Tax=Venturia inaequalis TaxID=5025 RepID=A0A8H3VTP3_VENIN|nr:hypothetical protein BLS_007537 [Venturia inaequalis]KAE9993960.1 hypothetical protein EG327_002294 [Venturia inaequalis]